MIFSFIVEDKDFFSRRLDACIAQKLGITRNQIKNRLISATINGKAAKLSKSVELNDEITVELQDEEATDIVAENIPLKIIFEDKDVIVVDKQQGMVVHPGCGNYGGTLVNALAFYLGNAEEFENKKCRPFIVHRLDKDTSGLIICAKNVAAQEFLQEQFRNRKVKKTYVAILKGILPQSQGEIKNYISRHSTQRKKFACNNEGKGKFAHSLFRTVKTFSVEKSGKADHYSLVKVRIKTGRTHQIRVHMKSLNCPILGDVIYGRSDENFPKAALMLHAYKLKIQLPDGEVKTFRSPLPQRFKDVM
ncbi:MAG: RluA family pseudouridine synthase [Spirochaetaceae bacterium]|nr:RluA family pseudouridine synthase [Spirochaetaceae bacterium]